MDNSNKQNTFNIFHLVQLIPGILIGLGLFKLYIKYWLFGFDIIEYISLSEALKAFLFETLLAMIVSFFLWAFLFKPFRTKIENLRKRIEDVKALADSEKTTALEEIDDDLTKHEWNFGIISRFGRFDKGLLLFLIVLTVIILFFRFYENEASVELILKIVLALLYIIGLMVIINLASKIDSAFVPGIKATLVRDFFFVTMIILLFYSYRYMDESITLRFGNKEANVSSIVLDKNSEIKLDSNLVFIGRVENFTFLYNRTTNEKTVLPNTEIKKYIYR